MCPYWVFSRKHGRGGGGGFEGRNQGRRNRRRTDLCFALSKTAQKGGVDRSFNDSDMKLKLCNGKSSYMPEGGPHLKGGINMVGREGLKSVKPASKKRQKRRRYRKITVFSSQRRRKVPWLHKAKTIARNPSGVGIGRKAWLEIADREEKGGIVWRSGGGQAEKRGTQIP